MSAVFISWSGKRGKQIAAALHRLMGNVARELDVVIDISFSPNLPIGADWRKQLHDELLRARLGVILLEPASLQSSWVAFEAGFIVAAGGYEANGTPVLFPLLLGDSGDAVRGTPFEHLQCAVLSKAGIEALLRTMFRAVSVDVAKPLFESFVDSCFEELSSEWQTICHEESVSHHAMLSALKETVESHQQFGLLLGSETQQFLDVFGAVNHQQLFEELSQISHLFRECLTEKNQRFSKLAIEWALPNLITDTRLRLKQIVSGKIPVRNRASVREFWLNAVIGGAQKSIWTTNLARLGGNMGNDPDPQLLRSQKEATTRGISITRMFVYDPGMTREEAVKRRKLMRDQIGVGIKVLAITTNDFNTKCVDHDARKRIGADDFMIIDNENLYLTRPEDNDIESELLNGQLHAEALRRARGFSEVLEGFADEITLENVDRFPRIEVGDADGYQHTQD